ncbi:MAG: hypothetical protein DRR42_17165 [Gammaproteobacteria bacterium]|nr:MAG: hypothetical protein DRR42_17165 [Gammaproteobacteria bacterium]
MSNENIVCSHELIIRFDQLEDGSVNWLVQPSAAVANTKHANFEELTEAGAPLSALGIKALWELLGEKLITFALEKANGYLWKNAYKRLDQQVALDSFAGEGELASDADESTVIH